MHNTAYHHARIFFENYWAPHFTDVIDFRGRNLPGQLRDHSPEGARYLTVDTAAAEGVDLVIGPGESIPLPDASVDVAIASSALHSDVFFWETFIDLARLLKPGGLLYVNAPSNSSFHRLPLDCWRFYPDAGLALSAWSRQKGVPVELIESFVARPDGDGGWADFVAVFRRPSDQALVRRGRVADGTNAMNIFDGLAPAANGALENESQVTYDMFEMAEVRQNATKVQAERDRLQKTLQTATGKNVELSAKLENAENYIAQIQSSFIWRATALPRKLVASLSGSTRSR